MLSYFQKVIMRQFVKFYLFLSFTLLSILAIAKDGYMIKAKIDGYNGGKCQLAYRYEAQMYLEVDSVMMDKKGVVVFKGEEPLKRGIYLVVLPDKNFFELLIGDEQEITVETDKENIIKGMEIKGSLDNELFYGFLKFWTQKQEENKKLEAELQILKAIEKPKKSDEQRIEEINRQLKSNDEAAKAYQIKIAEKNPSIFYAKVLNAMQEIEIPDPPKDPKGNMIDSNFTYKYYKAHFWDNIDLTEDGLVRTPILKNKFNTYMDKLTLQIPDSIIKSVDYLINRTPKESELIKYFLANMLNKYANSNIMGMDAVYVHIVDNYYANGYAYWVDETNLFRIKDRAKSLSPILIGKEAPQMVLKNTEGKYVSMHDVASKHKYTILFFWDPDCGHCKKAVPKLDKAFQDLKGKGIDVAIYSACVEVEDEKWKKFVKEKDLHDWIHVADIERHSYFRSDYDINSTPKIFIVDQNKKIIAKRLGAEQVEDFILRYDKSKDGKLGPIQMIEDSAEEHE